MSFFSTTQKLFDWVYEHALWRKDYPEFKTQWIGHRGVFDHPKIKENTLEAFELAIQSGAGVELDLRLSKDQEIMIMHDPNAQRVFGIPFRIQDHTAREWKQIEPRIPTLRACLERYPQCPFWMIEIKNEQDSTQHRLLLQKLALLLKEFQIESKVCLLGLDAELLDLYQEILPHIRRSFVYLLSPAKGLDYLKKHEDCGLMGWYMSFPATNITIPYKGVGFVNYPTTASKIGQRGFEFVFSDRVDRIQSIVSITSIKQGVSNV